MEGLGGLEGMLGQLDVNSEEGEDQFLMMMQGMMSTLLSKDVLYPSLMELRKQVDIRYCYFCIYIACSGANLNLL